MEKWCVITRTKTDEFIEVCQSKYESTYKAFKNWSNLSISSKQESEILACIANLDNDNNYFENEDGEIDSDLKNIVWCSPDYNDINPLKRFKDLSDIFWKIENDYLKIYVSEFLNEKVENIKVLENKIYLNDIILNDEQEEEFVNFMNNLIF